MENWNLKEVYSKREEYLDEIEQLKKEIAKIPNFKNKLDSLSNINEYFLYEDNIYKKLSKIYSFLSMQYDISPMGENHLEDKNLIENVYMDFEASISFLNNELLSHDLDFYLNNASKYPYVYENLYRIKKLFRTKDHIKNDEIEKVFSSYRPLESISASLYQSLSNSDFQKIEVTLSDGSKVFVTPGNYTSHLLTKNQEDRRRVFEAYFSYFDRHKYTYSQIYRSVVEADIALMKNRNYDTILKAHLFEKAIPDEVYLSLIDTVRKNSEPLKKYINLRKKILNLDTYHTYDRFLSTVKNPKEYPYQKAKEMVLEATKVMGLDYYNYAKEALLDGHVDIYPKEQKKSGAYSTEIEGYGPYILLNYTNSIDSAFALAHECGHSIHTLFSSNNQPYQTKNYELFVAEVASTFNEAIFLDYILEHSSDKDELIEAITQSCDNIVLTFYRQTLFADFEYEVRKLRLEGASITPDLLNKIMHDLYLDYYGIDLDSEPLKKLVWAYIPHIYHTPFYVYQYATSFSASMMIHENLVRTKDPSKMLNLLKAGGSKDPIEIIKDAGCDLTKKEPFIAVCNRLDFLVDKLSHLVGDKNE